MSRRSVVCLVCGLLATCLLAFVAYRYLLSSSGEAEFEHREQSVKRRDQQVEQKVDRKQAEMSTWKVSDGGSVPRDVLSKVDAVKVEEKTATFAVEGRVSLTFLAGLKALFNLHLHQVKKLNH